MNTRGLLDQLLKSGQDLLQNKAGSPQQKGASGGTSALGSLLSGASGGALAAGAMGLLLGSKRPVKSGARSRSTVVSPRWACWLIKPTVTGRRSEGDAAATEPQTLDRVPAAQVELHSQAILKALVAAAKADGHVDERERALIEGEFTRLDSDRELQHWLHAELNKPLDPSDVARAALSPEIAAEMYIASVMMVDEENFMEKAYLDELARQLKLEPGLKAELEKQVRQASL